MAINTLKDIASIRHQLGKPPETTVHGNWQNSANIGIEEGSTQINVVTISSTIWTASDLLHVWGSGQWNVTSASKSTIPVRIINPGYKFHEHFRDTLYVDMDLTTATVDLVAYKIK